MRQKPHSLLVLCSIGVTPCKQGPARSCETLITHLLTLNRLLGKRHARSSRATISGRRIAVVIVPRVDVPEDSVARFKYFCGASSKLPASSTFLLRRDDSPDAKAAVAPVETGTAERERNRSVETVHEMRVVRWQAG